MAGGIRTTTASARVESANCGSIWNSTAEIKPSNTWVDSRGCVGNVQNDRDRVEAAGWPHLFSLIGCYQGGCILEWKTQGCELRIPIIIHQVGFKTTSLGIPLRTNSMRSLLDVLGPRTPAAAGFQRNSGVRRLRHPQKGTEWNLTTFYGIPAFFYVQIVLDEPESA